MNGWPDPEEFDKNCKPIYFDSNKYKNCNMKENTLEKKRDPCMISYSNFVDILNESFAENQYIQNIEKELVENFDSRHDRLLKIKARIFTEIELSDIIVDDNILMDKNININNNYTNDLEKYINYLDYSNKNIGLTTNEFLKVLHIFVNKYNDNFTNKHQLGVRISNISNNNVNLNDNSIESQKNHSVNYTFFCE